MVLQSAIVKLYALLLSHSVNALSLFFVNVSPQTGFQMAEAKAAAKAKAAATIEAAAEIKASCILKLLEKLNLQDHFSQFL
jgi:hypothetical protein